MRSIRIAQWMSTQPMNTNEAILKKLQSKQTVSMTRDNYRVDIGLIIQRDPIFLKYTTQDMEYKKLRYQIEKKYNQIPKLPKEMYDFQLKTPAGENTSDDLPSHLKQIGDQRTFFRENSKWYRFVDPQCDDPKSIQYGGLYTTYLLFRQNGKWVFPTMTIEDKQTFFDSKEKLFKKATNNKWEAWFYDRYPRVCITREIQLGDSKLRGTKTFYFLAKHMHGKITTSEEYSEYVWATRLDMNKYLDQTDYENFIHSLDL